MPTHMTYHEFMSNPTPELLEAFGWWGVDDWETYFTEGECQALDITGTLSMDEMTQRWDDYIPIPTYSFPTDPGEKKSSEST